MVKKDVTYIEPIDKLPRLLKKTKKGVMYDKTLEQFLSSNSKIAKVKPEVGKSAAVFSALTKRVRKKKLPIKLRVRTDPDTKKMSIYLERTDI
jgi:hypothetical protein